MIDPTRRILTTYLFSAGLAPVLLPKHAGAESSTQDQNEPERRLIIDARAPIDSVWKHRKFVNETVYENVSVDGVEAIRAQGTRSASGLIKKLDIDPYRYRKVDWQWRVDQLQQSADITVKEHEDFAAVIFFLFGKPGLLFRGIRSLGYVWTTSTVAVDSVVLSVGKPEQSRFLCLQSGTENLGRWIDERRDLIEDYERVYGEPTPAVLSGISIFVDNDQTGEPVTSLFGNLYAGS